VAAEHYGRYIYTDPNGNANVKVPMLVSQADQFQNLGYLYPAKYIGNGEDFFCPGYNNKPTSLLGAEMYMPLLTTSAAAGSGATESGAGDVRSSYCWNLWAGLDTAHLRRFPKTSSFHGAVKCILNEYFVPGGSATAPVIDPLQMAHSRSKSLVVAYSDFSVKSIQVTHQMMTDAFNTGNLGWGAADTTPGTLGALLTDIEYAQ
jgi:hypothetical protein